MTPERLRNDPTQRAYLGDAVYAQIDEIGRLVLTTENGIETTNTIVFEPEVIIALHQYMQARFELERE